MIESVNLYLLELNSLYVKHIWKEAAESLKLCRLQMLGAPFTKIVIHGFDSSVVR